MARNLWDLAPLLLGVIPDNDPEREEFKARLDALEKSARYTAPEVMHTRWEELQTILYLHYPDGAVARKLAVLVNDVDCVAKAANDPTYLENL